MRINGKKQVEPGSYPGEFREVQDSFHDEYGAGLRWVFCISNGEIISRITQPTASAKNSCGQFLEMVSGLPIHEAMKHDTNEWSGQPGTIVVEAAGENVRVAKFIREKSVKSK